MNARNPAGGQWMPVAMAGAVGLVVLAARWLLVAKFGSAVPYLDQWDGEGALLYSRIDDGSFHWTHLLEPHTLHRPLLPHAWNVGWFLLFGGWDPIGQMVVNALIPALLAGFITFVFLPMASGRLTGLLASIAGVAIWAWPWGYQNALWGFQSQFLGMVFLSLVGVVGSLSWSWSKHLGRIGVAALFLAPLTMSAGGLAPLAVAIASLVAWRVSEKRFSRGWVRLAAISSILFLGGLLWTVDAGAGADTRVRSILTWSRIFTSALAWPWSGLAWWSLATLIPLGVWTVMALRRRTPVSRTQLLLFGVSSWSLLSAAALAWIRGGAAVTSFVPVSRYLDALVPGIVAGGALWWILPGRSARFSAIVWSACIALGAIKEGHQFLTRTSFQLEVQRTLHLEAAYAEVQSGFPGVYLQQSGVHPDSAVLRRVALKADEGNWLPPELARPPLDIWEKFGALGTVIESGLAGESRRTWRSPDLLLGSSRWMIMAKGVKSGRVLPKESERVRELVKLGDAGGAWQRWGIAPEADSYVIELETDGSSGQVMLWPRPLSEAAYWTRRILALSPYIAGTAFVTWIATAVYTMILGTRVR